MSPRVFILLTGFMLSGLIARVAPAAEPREVPEKLVPVINAGQRALEEGNPAAALRILNSYEGDADPLQQILIGYAHLELDQGVQAEAAFRRATELDPELQQARMGLARAQAAQENWAEVMKTLRGRVALDEDPPAVLGLYARAAFEAGDLRLAAVVAEHGVVRFPDDIALRRLDVAILLQREDWEEAAQAALGLLSVQPNDALLWRQLAAAMERSDATLSTAALEAASMITGGEALAVTHAARLVQEEAPDAALRVLEKVDTPPDALLWAAVAEGASDRTALAAGSNPEKARLEVLREAVLGGRADRRVLWSFGQTALQEGRFTEEGRRALTRLASSCESYGARAAALLAARQEDLAKLWLNRCVDQR
ncbi:MAG: tetratricopeptide repeat protein [Myxococcota bacterium]